MVVAAALAAVGSAHAYASPPPPLASVAAQWGIEIRCYPTSAEYFADSGIPPVDYWLGIAGFYGVPRSVWGSPQAAPVIGLTQPTCDRASRVQLGATVPRAYATFTIAHELAHALGAVAEAQADCQGATMLAQVAQTLGLPPAAYATLLHEAQISSGYSPIPTGCWAQVSS